jgi:phosphatidylinositol glycan class C protein
MSMIILSASLFPQSNSSSPVALLSIPLIVLIVVISLVNLVGPSILWYGWRWKTRRGGGWEVAKIRIRRGKEGKG